MMDEPKQTNVLAPSQFEEQQRYARAAGKFQHSWMSNAKWRKVFTAIANAATNVTRCEYKCIDSESISKNNVPQLTDIDERRFADAGYQPFEYKWIEWFRFPRRYKPHPGVGYVIEQEVETLKAAIEAASHARTRLDSDYLWLYGYSNGAEAQQG